LAEDYGVCRQGEIQPGRISKDTQTKVPIIKAMELDVSK
jgi:hypothetical protein